MSNIIIPKYDDSVYHSGRLDNKIKYIIINNENITNTKINVIINCGSYHNKGYYDGIAHFLEHMLFLGSKKYSNKEQINITLDEFQGSCNAETAGDYTMYYCSFNTDGIKKVFDVFSRFFIDPLIEEKHIRSEVYNVHSEHIKNSNNSDRALYLLLSYLANKDSKVNGFYTGSLETLDKKDVRQHLINFFKKYYVSENICISVVTNNSIKDTIKQLENSFGKIKHGKSRDVSIDKPIYSDVYGKMFLLKIPENIMLFNIIWEIT